MKRWVRTVGVIVGVLLFAALIHAFIDDPVEIARQTEITRPTPQPTLTRKEYVEIHFSRWDGSHASVVAYVKARMHNPSSFQHIYTSYQDHEKNLLITMMYSGTNAFNARVQEKVLCEVEVRTGIVHRCVSQ